MSNCDEPTPLLEPRDSEISIDVRSSKAHVDRFEQRDSLGDWRQPSRNLVDSQS